MSSDCTLTPNAEAGIVGQAGSRRYARIFIAPTGQYVRVNIGSTAPCPLDQAARDAGVVPLEGRYRTVSEAKRAARATLLQFGGPRFRSVR